MRYPNKVEVKFTISGYRIPVTLWNEKERIFFNSGFNRNLIAEIKSMQGHKWHGYDENNPRKLWSVADTERNHFAIDYLQGLVVYAPYEQELDTSWVIPTRMHLTKGLCKLLGHQPEMAAHIYQRHYSILAGEMGTSKTLPLIIAAERALTEAGVRSGETDDFWYISPKAALEASKREFRIWGSKYTPRFMTYEGNVKEIKAWKEGKLAPIFVTLDESSKVKNWKAQRTIAAYELAKGVRQDRGLNGWVCEMSGSPAPKSPMDWWAQAEIARPGFLKEGDEYKFKNRLAVVIQKEGGAGGAYPELVTWKDKDGICEKCGIRATSISDHNDQLLRQGYAYHDYIPSKNEVAILYERLKGLVMIKFKKDCLDLPDKVYKVIKCKIDPKVARAAKMLMRSSATVIEGLTRVRELSDGFQYEEEVSGYSECPTCRGRGIVQEYETEESVVPVVSEPKFMVCPQCKGKLKIPTYKRTTKAVPCPKDDELKDQLDYYEDVGRIVIFAGFEGSIERCVKLCQSKGWHVIQLNDSKQNVWNDQGAKLPIKDWISLFQDQQKEYPRVAFVAHPGSGGMGLTLTASPVIIYYSNDFNAENRIQSEDRIHRTGMDYNLGATIIDLVHLDTDLTVLANLKRKRDLQAMTLGDIESSDVSGFNVEER